MVAQPSRRRQAEGVSHDVRGLPYTPARVGPERRPRRIPAGIFANGALLAGQHAHASATAAARPARRAPGGHRRCRQSGRGISREREPRQFRGDRISAQDAPAPKGRSTKVLITEYDLPRKGALPHDVIVDKDGQVWTPISAPNSWASWTRRAERPRTLRSRWCGPRSRKAASTSSSTPTAISGWR